MAGQQPPYNLNYYGGYTQERPRSLIDQSWTFNPVPMPATYAPQHPTPQQQQFVQPPVQTQVFNTRAPLRGSTTRPPRPRASAPSASSGPLNNKQWMKKLEVDAESTVLDFQEAVEVVGVPFSEKLKNRLNNAKAVGGEIMNAICVAATASELENVVVGIDGVQEKKEELSFADQVISKNLLDPYVIMPDNLSRANSSEEYASQSSPSGSSSYDSDDTIVQAELLKQLEIPSSFDDIEQAVDKEERDVISVNTSSNSVTPSNENDEDVLGIDSNESPAPPLPMSGRTSCKSSLKIDPPKAPSTHQNINQISHQGTHNTQANQLRKSFRSVVGGVKKSSVRSISSKIRQTKKLQQVVNKEIDKREKLAELDKELEELSGDPVPMDSRSPTKVSNYEVAIKKPRSNKRKLKPEEVENSMAMSLAWQSKLNSSGKIPRLLLDPSVVKTAIEKVAGRNKLSTSYNQISEILRIKKLLAKGNPFVIIPQFAYDISKVPGIRLAHIQQLLKQWENYFAEYLYQIVQLEYSVDFGEVQTRISTMVDNDKYSIIREFQSFVGQDEVSMENFVHKGKKVEKEPSPSHRKVQAIDNYMTNKKNQSGKRHGRRSSSRSTKGPLMSDMGKQITSNQELNLAQQSEATTSKPNDLDDFVF